MSVSTQKTPKTRHSSGPRSGVGYSTLLGGLLTALVPERAPWCGVMPLVVSRFNPSLELRGAGRAVTRSGNNCRVGRSASTSWCGKAAMLRGLVPLVAGELPAAIRT